MKTSYFRMFCLCLDNDAISSGPESEWYIKTAEMLSPESVSGLITDLKDLLEAKLTDDELAKIFYATGTVIGAKTNAAVRLLIRDAHHTLVEARRSGRLPLT